mmetsp:Transcript_16911/g.25495  ORF Transcript_16911/g.25495 Transcript_16911/m.25495 type:complete len:365 (-) Transcript_16911:105-1199(-)
MGAGASTMPSKLTKDDLYKVCDEMYDSFKDSDGLVDKEMLIAAAFSGQEKEVYDLYCKFAPDGKLDAQGFMRLCKAAKLLHKKTFTIADGVRAFEKSRNTSSIDKGEKVQYINYNIFRNLLVPDIASKKEVHIDNLIFKLSRVEARVPMLLRKKDDDFDLGDLVVHVQAENVDDDDDDTSVHAAGTPQQHKAARRIQSCSRMRMASRYVNGLKEINSTANVIKEEDFDKPVDKESETEATLERYFKKICRTGEMDLSKFVKMCRDCGIIDKCFTSVDVELCFLKARIKASSKECPEYNSGVFHGKRISYKVFREILLRCIVEKKGVPMQVVTHHLVNGEANLVSKNTTPVIPLKTVIAAVAQPK